MVDDRDETVRQHATLIGTGHEDVGSAETQAPSVGPLPPPPTPSFATTQPFARATDSTLSLDGSRYAIGQLIGEGGMGEVLLAIDERIGREVAVKRTRNANPSGEELSRFVREARVQGRLEHPAVVPVHDLAIDPTGRPYFVMKRLAGEPMSDVLQRLRAGDDFDESVTRRRLLRAFVEVCLAVEFAHSKGIIHRDLKPANIMLGDFGEVYVIDWGIARAVTEPDDTGTPPSGQHDLKLATGDTRQGTVLGTPAYMSPEQLAGDRAGPAADIYALGCILFEIAAGGPLHARMRTIGEALSEVDCKPSSRRADSPPELDAICARACEIEASTRYETARSLGNAVQSFLDGDRDTAARKKLAQQHVEQARSHLAKGEAEEHRRAAMSAAGRALALDPTASEAGELVTRLMLEPPKQVPVEVAEALASRDIATGRTQGRLAALAMISYLAFVPIMMWTGIRDVTWIPIFALVAILSGVQVFALTYKERIHPAGIYLNACINAVLIGIVCRIVGPFIIAPTLVTTTMVGYAAHPQLGRMHVVALILSMGVVVPWCLEIAGVVSPTYHFVDGTLVLTSPVIELSSQPVQIAFALLLVILTTVVGVLSRGLSKSQRDATRKLELQAWHLRQIMPSR
ncbi:MAG: serine/threonine protein kinase [Myxococcota bacterium]|nr:serine/threonine protein kinase [Myxococcota bacterium]